jgi:predicted N-acyltransferase
MAIEVRLFDSIAQIERAAWDALFPNEIEAWRYFTLWQEDALVAAAPAFLTDYRLDTTLAGPLKRWTDRLARLAPRLLSIRMLCLGSPVAEICHVGTTRDATPQQRQALLARLLQALRDEAARRHIGLVAVKDAPDGSDLAEACGLAGHTRLPGMPTAVLPLHFSDLDGYLKTLSRVTRKDIKRKLRHSQALRVEARADIDDVMGPVMALYEATWQRSDLRLEHLTPEYFTAVLAAMRGRAICFLYWQDERLVAFNLVLHDSQRMIDKFFGTDGTARQLNLYHLSWMENIRQCLARRLIVFQAGQAFYREKVRMGSRLDINWQFFQHRSPVLDFLLRKISGLVRLDRIDPEIRSLMTRSK